MKLTTFCYSLQTLFVGVRVQQVTNSVCGYRGATTHTFSQALDEGAKATAIASLTDNDGCTLDDLCLDFLVPGTDLELKPGKDKISDCPMTDFLQSNLCCVQMVQ